MTCDTINEDMTRDASKRTRLANRYRMVRQLGQGGMGSVWLAEDTQLDGKLFAIKMLPSILVSNKRAYRQLKDEALVAMKLTHSNIVTLRAFEENNGNPFLVMDYIDGETLDDYLAEHSSRVDRVEGESAGIPEDEVIRILRPIAAALDYAHGEGVVHRDVKPANVMIRKDGHPFILDFGIAREIQETLTRVTGKLSSGTLLYMSPEQLNGGQPKPAQDVYSFAAMAYECLKGEPPFVRGVIEDQIKNKAPEPPVGASVPLARAIMAGLAKKPEDRPKNCAAVLGGGDFSRVKCEGVEVSHSLKTTATRDVHDRKDGRMVASHPPSVLKYAVDIPVEDLRYLPPEARALVEHMISRDDNADFDVRPPSCTLQGDKFGSKERKERKAGGGKLLAVLALFAALAGGGAWLYQQHLEAEAERGVDVNAAGSDNSKHVITFLVDVSGSMEALDLTPNSSSLSNAMTRLDIVKRVLADYAIKNPTRQLGLVSFAGFATIRARPGCAHDELLNQISALEVPAMVFDKDGSPHNSGAQMTSVGEGLAAAISAFNDEGIDSKRVIVLLSDGVSNSGKTTVEDAICMAVSNKIHICTIGIGTNSKRTPFRVRDSFGRLSVAYANTSFDSSQLKTIAFSSGGRFVDVTNEQGLREAIALMTDPNTELTSIPKTEIMKALAAGAKFGASNQLAANEEQRCISLISRRFYECWTDFNWSENLRPVLLSVRFGGGGKILGYRIVQSSGDAKVDQSVLAAAKRADHVSGLSAEFLKQYPEITISMTPKRQ